MQAAGCQWLVRSDKGAWSRCGRPVIAASSLQGEALCRLHALVNGMPYGGHDEEKEVRRVD